MSIQGKNKFNDIYNKYSEMGEEWDNIGSNFWLRELYKDKNTYCEVLALSKDDTHNDLGLPYYNPHR